MTAASLSPSVRRLYDEWRRCWAELDGEAMTALFTDREGALIYQAEEFPRPFTTMAKLQRYWASVPAEVIQRIERWEERSLDAIVAGRVTVIEVLTDTTLRLHGNVPLIEGVLRSTLVIEEDPDTGAAELLHYHESRALKLALCVA